MPGGLHSSMGMPGQKRGAQEYVGRSCEVALKRGEWHNSEIVEIKRDERGIDRATLKVLGMQGTADARKEVRL